MHIMVNTKNKFDKFVNKIYFHFPFFCCYCGIESWPLNAVIYTATIPGALTGADVAIFASAFAYISDVSSVEHRTLRVTILDVCYLTTFPLGIALGKFFHIWWFVFFGLNQNCELTKIFFLFIFRLIPIQPCCKPVIHNIVQYKCNIFNISHHLLFAQFKGKNSKQKSS